MLSKTIHTALIALGLSMLACGMVSQLTPTTSVKDIGVNILVVAEGEVQLKRQNWSDYYPTTFGAELQSGDIVRASDDARAVVLCSDLTLWSVAVGVPSGVANSCPRSDEPLLLREGGAIANTRDGSDPKLPYILSPRATKLLASTPLLRWNSASNANSYSVRIVEGSQTVWEAKTTATEIRYPGDPPLRANKTYLLIVMADTGMSSEDEKVAGLGFSLLDYAGAERVHTSAERLDQVSLTSDARTFVLAKLYASAGLTAEAIELLEGLIADGYETPNIYHTLGALYQRVSLLALSESRYTRALELAETMSDTEVEAAAQAGLGTVAAGLGRTDDALKWLEQAKAEYDAMGDTNRSVEIDQQIKLLR